MKPVLAAVRRAQVGRQVKPPLQEWPVFGSFGVSAVQPGRGPLRQQSCQPPGEEIESFGTRLGRRLVQGGGDGAGWIKEVKQVANRDLEPNHPLA
jgi:hypothetical protein